MSNLLANKRMIRACTKSPAGSGCRCSGHGSGGNAELLIQPVIGEGSQEALSISAKPKHGVVATATTFLQPIHAR